MFDVYKSNIGKYCLLNMQIVKIDLKTLYFYKSMFNLLKNKALTQKYLQQKTFKKLCLAPEKSMRFTLSGNVISCCYNRGFILGNVRKDSLHDIWFGEKAKELQKALSEKNLSKGCQTCAFSIYNNNFNAVPANQYDYLNEQKNMGNYPTMLDFEISSECNLECIMCSGEYSSSIRINREKKTPYQSPYEDKFVEELTEFLPHLNEARFVGGEPFLIKLHYKIWEKIIEVNPKINITVLTNGTTLTNKIKSILDKGNFTLSISIDGISKEVYERIRKNALFEEVMQNVDFFREYNESRGKNLIFNVCAMRQNYHDLPNMLNYCNQNNIELILHTVYFPHDCSLWNLNESELERILELYAGIHFSAQNELQEKNNQTFKGLISQIKSFIKNKEFKPKTSTTSVQSINKLEGSILAYCKKTDNADANTHLVTLYDLLSNFDESGKFKVVEFLIDLPIHLLVSELNITDSERMLERFKLLVNERKI